MNYALRSLFAVAVLGTMLSGCGEGPGGMPPTYQARDYDMRLTGEARNAIPIIDALKRFSDEHAAFPKSAAELKPYLPTLPTMADETIAGWRYERGSTGRGFTLSRKLGWDPILQYELSGSEGRWIFCPGDGTPDKPILLKP